MRRLILCSLLVAALAACMPVLAIFQNIEKGSWQDLQYQGRMAESKGDYATAEAKFIESIKLIDSNPSVRAELSQELAASYSELASIYDNKRKPWESYRSRAISYYFTLIDWSRRPLFFRTVTTLTLVSVLLVNLSRRYKRNSRVKMSDS